LISFYIFQYWRKPEATEVGDAVELKLFTIERDVCMESVMKPFFNVEPVRSLVDEPLSIRAGGLDPDEIVTIELSIVDIQIRDGYPVRAFPLGVFKKC
jgi:hypothetical protein